jgi:4-amino-4-deoxy-L-arabinose transferase-like glycosyltransferase
MTPAQRLRVRPASYAVVFAVIASFLILAHSPLLWLPFFWDEAGQFIPAALDLYHAGSWIPTSVVPNIHPPGVMAWLAGFWTVFGYSIAGTRIAMLLIASLGAMATFLLSIELARGSTGAPAFSTLTFLCISPLFFAQSLMAQLDMPAMCFTTLALLLFLQNRFRDSALACVALVLVKETGAVIPLVFGLWLLIERRREARSKLRPALWFLLPFAALLIWLVALRHSTGSWFGNPGFGDYNTVYTLDPARFLFALVRRFYYVFISTGHIFGTAILIYAFRRVPILHGRAWRIAGIVVAAHLFAVSLFGGAVLERYLLPVLPIVYSAFAVALRALLPGPRKLALAAIVLALLAANVINPPYPYPWENNLSFIAFVQLEQSAATAVDLHAGRIATAFPVSNGLRRPELGFVDFPHSVIEMAGFTAPDVERLRTEDPEMVLVFTRIWDPWHILAMPPVAAFLHRMNGYEPQLGPEQIADSLNMRVAFRWRSRGLSMQLLERVPVR